MDDTQLAEAMLEYQKVAKTLEELGESIKAAVMELAETQKVGSLTARYSKGRKSYDYATAWAELGDQSNVSIDEYITMTTKVDYNAACKAAGIKDIPFTQSDPSVSLKIK